MRSARLTDECFEPRAGFEPHWLQDVRTVRIWYSPAVARWEVERGARPLVDASAVADRAVGSREWLVGEMLRLRGEAIVLEPADLREAVAARARELAADVTAAARA
jgi:hypothetical protein